MTKSIYQRITLSKEGKARVSKVVRIILSRYEPYVMSLPAERQSDARRELRQRIRRNEEASATHTWIADLPRRQDGTMEYQNLRCDCCGSIDLSLSRDTRYPWAELRDSRYEDAGTEWAPMEPCPGKAPNGGETIC